MAVMPGFSREAYNYVDILVVVWLLVGLMVGRRRGMAQEVLPMFQWVLIVVLAGFFYRPVAQLLHQSTSGTFSPLWCNVIAYVVIGFAINMFFLWLKKSIGEKLTGSDAFGRAEYYLGMGSGLIQFACIFLALCALMNSRVYTSAELAEDAKVQRKNFEDIRFPTYMSVQHSILAESFTGRMVEDHLSPVLIASSVAPGPATTIARRGEETVNAILGVAKK